jgi:hypothetical protein
MRGVEPLILQIVAINHAWKLAKERWTESSSLVNSLRDRKSCLQVRLLRDFPTYSFLHLDEDNIEGEALYSVRLTQPIKLQNGYERRDAEHMPVRLAQEFFSEQELLRIVK